MSDGDSTRFWAGPPITTSVSGAGPTRRLPVSPAETTDNVRPEPFWRNGGRVLAAKHMAGGKASRLVAAKHIRDGPARNSDYRRAYLVDNVSSRWFDFCAQGVAEIGIIV